MKHKVEASNPNLPHESAGSSSSKVPEPAQKASALSSTVAGEEESLLKLRAAKKRKHHQFRLLGGATLLLLLLFLTSQAGRNWLSGFVTVIASQIDSQADPNSTLPSGSILPVETIAVKPVNSYQVSRLYSGTLVPRRSSELGFERAGKVSQISVNEGDTIEAGRAIAALDTEILAAQKRQLLAKRTQLVAQLDEMQAGSRPETIASAQATVRAMNEQLELASQKRDRREMLYAEGAISREQLDEIFFEASTRQARLDEARSQLDELLAGTRSQQIEVQTALIKQLDAEIGALDIEEQQSVLKAPFAGTVSNRLVDEGTIASAGQPIVQLVEAGATEARVGVPVTAADQIAIGSTQRVQIGQKTYLAKVTAILPELDSSTRTVTVVLILNQLVSTEVTLGQLAKLELTEDISTSGYWLPLSALVQGERSLWSCYVLGEAVPGASQTDSVFRVEQRDVEILHTQGDRALVRGTLLSGDQVIASGTHRLVAGQLVSAIATPD